MIKNKQVYTYLILTINKSLINVLKQIYGVSTAHYSD